MANAKLDVDIASFVSDINTAKGVLKGLNAEMKAADAEFKATGNSEQQLTAKTKTLNSQIRMQKSIVDNASKALEAMKDDGVDPADAAYQRMYATMMNANAGMNEAQAQLNALGSSAQEAATGADQLTSSVNKIGKKISLDQVISGIDRITGAMENAAKKAIKFGEEIWKNIMDSAQLSDDILTQAGMLDMTPEMYQRYKGVFDTIAEVTITEWAAAKRKVEKAMTDPSNDQIDVLRALGFVHDVSTPYGSAEVTDLADNWEQVFWDAATKLKSKVESGELTSEMADVYGEALFGKKYSNLKNLIDLGQEAFTAALGKQNVASDEALEKNAALNDAVINLQNSFKSLEQEVTSAMAPALTDAANALNDVLGSILEYLQKPEGQEMLQKLGDAISGLFGDLSKIDPDKVVSGFVEVFTKVTGGIQWLVDNADTAKGILATIVGAWGAITIGGNLLRLVEFIEGMKGLGLLGGGAAAEAATAGGASGIASAAGVAITGTLAKVLPNAASWSSVNGGPILDWVIHESPLAPVFNGIESLGDWWERQKSEFQERADSVGDNWDPNSPEANILMQNAKNNILYWDMIHKQQQAAQEWNFGDHMSIDEIEAAINGEGPVKVEVEPEIPENWDFGDHMSIDEIMKRINDGKPVDVPADLDNETTAEDIEKEIGTVVVPGVVQFDERGYPSSTAGFANGLPFVPYDNYLARLHKGERVLTANQNRHYTYNSNNYFGNVNLNNGQDIEALCNSIDRHNRRQRNGYGS